MTNVESMTNDEARMISNVGSTVSWNRFLRTVKPQDEAFQAEYAAARNAAYQAGIHRAQALTGRAMDTLEELLDAKINANVRLGAARTVAEIGIHQHDAETILQKLDEIESDQRRQQGR